MKIYKLIKMGEYHQDFCEDFLCVEYLDSKYTIIAVMDGCSMGIDSHFSSTLFGKIIKKIVQEKNYEDFLQKKGIETPFETLKFMLENIYVNLKNLKNTLLLDTKELLSTLILSVFDAKKGVVIAIGDGVINIDDKTISFEQENKPDYLAYHFGEVFEDWFVAQKQIITFENQKSISICTDGIDTFQKLNPKNLSEINPKTYLLQNMDYHEKYEMLQMKIKVLEKDFSLKATDDLAIIRVGF